MMTNNEELPEIKAEPLVSKVRELLADLILSGRIRPAERLNESQLARQLRLSRGPIREALHQLEEQGLLSKVPGHGMHVVSLSQEQVQKINSVRIIVEAEALRLCRANLTLQGEKKLLQIIKKMREMEGGSISIEEQDRIDLEFHRTVWSLAGNEYLEKILSAAVTPLFIHAFSASVRARPRDLTESHLRLLRFVQGKVRASAEEIMLEHLSSGWENPAKYSSLARASLSKAKVAVGSLDES